MMVVIVCVKLMVLYKKYKLCYWFCELELFCWVLFYYCRKKNVMFLKIILFIKSDRFL